MPFSDSENKEIAKGWYEKIKPRTVLDIGCGAGTYSDLMRTPDAHWTGLEVFYPYVDKFDLNSKYDRVIIGDARYIDYRSIGSIFNLIIAGDFIEHMPKDDAKMVIHKLVANGHNVIICFPVLHLDQEAYEGNDFEHHIDHWAYDEMMNFLNMSGYGVVDSVDGEILAYFWVSAYV